MTEELEKVIDFLREFTRVRDITGESCLYEDLGIDVTDEEFLDGLVSDFGVEIEDLLDEVSTVEQLRSAIFTSE